MSLLRLSKLTEQVNWNVVVHSNVVSYIYMKKIIIIILVVVLMVAVVFVFKRGDTVQEVDQSTTQNRVMSIENYVTIYISELSPVPEELGGRFYVTHITTGGGKGTVNYEDGHNAYIADFTYSYEDNKAIKMESFKIRE